VHCLIPLPYIKNRRGQPGGRRVLRIWPTSRLQVREFLMTNTLMLTTLYKTSFMFPPSGRSHFGKRTSAQLGGLLHTALVLTFLGIAVEQPAAAYTDPGSGAFILQMIAASLVGGLFYFRKFFAFFRRSPKDNKDPNE